MDDFRKHAAHVLHNAEFSDDLLCDPISRFSGRFVNVHHTNLLFKTHVFVAAVSAGRMFAAVRTGQASVTLVTLLTALLLGLVQPDKQRAESSAVGI